MADHDQVRIGFVGAGKMATALARGWMQAGLVTVERLLASDALPEARAAFTQATGARCLDDNRHVAEKSQVIVLAVKPQDMPAALAAIAPGLAHHPLLISVAAGVTLGAIAAPLGADQRLIRVMPNTPCLVGASASAYCPGPNATAADVALTDRLLQSVGRAFVVPEKLLDAVTGLSGSGPAYVFVFIDALSDGGVRMGLPRDVATQLAAQTVFGAAKMVLETGAHPAVLKDTITSPAGTTSAGLHALEHAGFRAALIDAVQAATERSIELGKQG